jgi:hypothetical protein
MPAAIKADLVRQAASAEAETPPRSTYGRLRRRGPALGDGWRRNAERLKATGNPSGRFLRYTVATGSGINPERWHSA